MSISNVLKLARHFKWNKVKIEDNYLLIKETDKDKLKIQLGMEFDQSLANSTKSTMVKNSDGYCQLCFFELDSEPSLKSFYLDECKHVFCANCT
jgi:hypothetical protein